jgi:cobalamin biosynthesis protein CbiM
MHIPDGFIDAPVSLAAGAVAIAGVGVCIRKAANDLDDRLPPLAGLVAAFVFAAQMLNFPVAAGTSGHLLGGVLAAVLVGPWAGALCVSVVLVIQALLFADGGLTALGLNIVNMALVGALGGYAVFVGLRRLFPKARGGLLAAAGVASWVSVMMACTAFSIEYALGGTGGASWTTVAGAMLGVHALIGIGEAVLTVLIVGAVLAVRPDLVYGARDLIRGRAPLPTAPAAPLGAGAVATSGAPGTASRREGSWQ